MRESFISLIYPWLFKLWVSAFIFVIGFSIICCPSSKSLCPIWSHLTWRLYTVSPLDPPPSAMCSQLTPCASQVWLFYKRLISVILNSFFFSCSLQGCWTFLSCLSITFGLYIYLRCVLFSFPAVRANTGTRWNWYIELVPCKPVKSWTSSFLLISLRWPCFCLQLEMALTVLRIPLPQLLPSCVLSVCLHHLQLLELFLHKCVWCEHKSLPSSAPWRNPPLLLFKRSIPCGSLKRVFRPLKGVI